MMLSGLDYWLSVTMAAMAGFCLGVMIGLERVKSRVLDELINCKCDDNKKEEEETKEEGQIVKHLND